MCLTAGNWWLLQNQTFDPGRPLLRDECCHEGTKGVADQDEANVAQGLELGQDMIAKGHQRIVLPSRLVRVPKSGRAIIR